MHNAGTIEERVCQFFGIDASACQGITIDMSAGSMPRIRTVSVASIADPDTPPLHQHWVLVPLDLAVSDQIMRLHPGALNVAQLGDPGDTFRLPDGTTIRVDPPDVL